MKVLIVDDEPGVAQWLAGEVGAAGGGEYFSASSAEEAVEIVNREGGIDVLVTGVFLDGADGFTLNETMRQHLPSLRTIFLSQYDLSGSADRVGDCPVLAKPVDAVALASVIHGAGPAVPQAASDPLLGSILGNYRVERLLGSDVDGNFYHAVQTNIERDVELHALDSSGANDPDRVVRFLADARTKANVHHPALLSVFEAGQQENVYFYTSETRSGTTLADFAASGTRLDARVVLQLLHSVAEVMAHLSHEKIAHRPLDPSHVIVDHRMRARLVNIASSEPSRITAVQEMKRIAAMIAPIVAESDRSRLVRDLLFEMGSESVTLRSWNALLYEVKRCASGAPSPHTHRLDASGHAAIKAVGAERRRQRMMRYAALFAIALVPLGVGGFWAWKFLKPVVVPSEGNPAMEAMVHVPAGEFLFQGNRMVDVPEFWIDAHEVTIGQYADFLAWVDAHPQDAAGLAAEGMPADHSYVPKGWSDEKTPEGVMDGYHSVARQGGEYEGAKLTLDSPVFDVDWYDAYSYAAWKGRRLPSEEEWEKAALGNARQKYPWGDEFQPGNANTGAQDGFPKWSNVDAVPGDKSPAGMIGAAGNVSEWTLTVARGDKGQMMPIIRGGNWSDTEIDMRRRKHDLEASQSAPTVGFRTATEKPPTPQQ